MIIANFFLTNYAYYSLLQYQVGSQVGRYFKTEHLPVSSFLYYKMQDPLNALNFYADAMLNSNDDVATVKAQKYVLTQGEGMDDLKKQGCSFDILKQGDFFKISELTPEFLNPKTRLTTLKTYYLLKME